MSYSPVISFRRSSREASWCSHAWSPVKELKFGQPSQSLLAAVMFFFPPTYIDSTCRTCRSSYRHRHRIPPRRIPAPVPAAPPAHQAAGGCSTWKRRHAGQWAKQGLPAAVREARERTSSSNSGGELLLGWKRWASGAKQGPTRTSRWCSRRMRDHILPGSRPWHCSCGPAQTAAEAVPSAGATCLPPTAARASVWRCRRRRARDGIDSSGRCRCRYRCFVCVGVCVLGRIP